MRKSAIVALVKDNKVLIQKRDDNPDIVGPGYWGIPGGIIESCETPKEAIIREFKEETGYKLKDPQFLKRRFFTIDGEKIKGYVFYEEYDGKQKIKCFEGQKMVFKSYKQMKNLKVLPDHDKFAKKAIEIVTIKRDKPNELLIIGSQGSVGKGILQAAKEQGIKVHEFDKKLGNYLERLTAPRLRNLTEDITNIIYTAEPGNRDLYEEDSTLVKTNLKNFTHFCKLVSELDTEIKIYYIGGSWTKRRIPKDFIVKDQTPNKTKVDNPNSYERAKIAAEENAKKLAKSFKLDITYLDWISIVPNYSQNFTINKFMQELLTTGQISYTPGNFGRPLLASKDTGKALLLYIKNSPNFKGGQFKKVLIPGIFTTFEIIAKVVLKTAKELSQDGKFKKEAKLVKRTDNPPDFLKARVESRLFKSIGFKPSRVELKKALRENAGYAFGVYHRTSSAFTTST